MLEMGRSAAKRENMEQSVTPSRKWALNGERIPGNRWARVRFPIRPDSQRSGLADRVNQERYFRQRGDTERAELVKSHHHAGPGGDIGQLVSDMTGSRAGGCGQNGALQYGLTRREDRHSE